MNLKTSYFNMPLFGANLKRFWWIGALYFVAFMSIGVLVLVNDKQIEGFAAMNAFSMFLAAIMPVIFFSYLNSSGAVTCLHAFPIKRKAHYITHIKTMYILILVPAVISYLIGIGYCYATHLLLRQKLLMSALALIPLITFAMSCGVLGVMCTGNSIAAIAFSGIFIGLPFYSETMIRYFLELNIHGIYVDSPYVMSNFRIDSVNTYMLVLTVASIAVFFLSWLLYKHRHLEVNGDIISYNFLKPIFIAGVSIFSGLIGYFYLNSLTFSKNIALLLPFGIIGIVISYMLSKKAFTVKGIYKPLIVYGIAVFAVFAVIHFDLTGFERRIPDIDDIESIELLCDTSKFFTFYEYPVYSESGTEYYFKNETSDNEFTFYDKEDFSNILKAHAKFIEKDSQGTTTLPIVYTLKNGKKLKRQYQVSYIADKDVLKPLYETEQMRKYNHPMLIFDDVTVSSLRIFDTRLTWDDKTFAIYSGSDERTKQLYEAVLKDASEANYEDVISYDSSLTTINIDFTRPLVTKDGKDVDLGNRYELSDSFGIPLSYKRTVKLLKEYGLYDQIVKIQDIDNVKLYINYDSDNSVTITDAKDIESIYEYVSNSHLVWDIETQSPFNLGSDIYGLTVEFYRGDNLLFQISQLEDFIEKPPQVLYTAVQNMLPLQR